MHALVVGCWIRHRFPCTGTSSAHRAWLLALEVPTFPRIFEGFFELLLIQINNTNASQLTRIVELRFLDGPLRCSSFR